MRFEDLGLAEPILRAVLAEGYTTPTPIQAKAIPHVLEGRDLLGCAQTGTGKTAAFALPILHRLSKSRTHVPAPPPALAPAAPGGTHRGHHHPREQIHHRSHAPARPIRSLILAPTRELAAQIGDSFRAYGQRSQLKYTVIFGGVGQNPQVTALRQGVDIVVATPGRLLDLMNQGHVDLRSVEVFVLDEADRMLDMGFIHDIRKIAAKLPERGKRQTLLFSATMPGDIRDLANSMLSSPVSVEVAPVSATADRIEQGVYFVEKRNKSLLLIHLMEKTHFTRTLVFTRTKHGADKVAKQLTQAGTNAEAIHGNKSQNARQRALENFRSGKTPVLVASDIAARGIDIDEISHVINYDVPNVPETYVHRIGRTARAGASGSAISFCDHEERPFLRDIERLTKINVPVLDDMPKFPARPEFVPQEHQQRGRGPARPHSGGQHRGGHKVATPHSQHAPKPHGNAQQPAEGQSHAPAKPQSSGHSQTGQGAHPEARPHTGGRPPYRGGKKLRRRW